MRIFTELEQKRLKTLTEYSFDLTFVEPTKNGLKKSILDATGIIRTFLKEKNIHDYILQNQGEANKITLKSYFIYQNGIEETSASLYRPITKKGDPRIWFKGLSQYANPHDIIAIFSIDDELYLINLTKFDVTSLIEGEYQNPLREFAYDIRNNSNYVANELLALLLDISKMGPVPALLNADTGIGRTLETLLGININSSKKPDYKGIELKAFRDKRNNRKSLFAQVPDWNLSKFKSSAEILQKFGYKRGLDYKLYCTVSSLSRNSQGLQLKIDNELGLLLENSNKSNIGDFICWSLEVLHQRLLEKHNETFWISAESTIQDGVEYFHFKGVEHTKKPIISQFDLLLEQGKITVDHLIKKTPSGKVVEKGPLFKIGSKSLNLIFPPSQLYELS